MIYVTVVMFVTDVVLYGENVFILFISIERST